MPRLHTSGFAALPYALLDQLGDHKNIGWLYLWLYRHGHGSEQGAWASIATLARECHMNRDAVKTGLRWLVANGWIQRSSRPGRSSSYFLCLDADHTARPARPPNEGQHLAPKQGPTPKGDPAFQQGLPPAPRTGANTWPPNGGHKQEPRNQNPETRSQAVSSNSLVPLSLSALGPAKNKGEEIRSAQPTGQSLPDARPPQTDRAPRFDQCPERPDHIPAGHPDDPTWAYVLAHPEFPWGGPYAAKPPAEPPAHAPRLPLRVDQLPAGLQPIADRIEEFWLSKAGSRTPTGFRALVEELSVVLPAAGRSGVVEVLRQAAQAGWPAINARAWLSQRSREPDLSTHPAYRPFMAA